MFTEDHAEYLQPSERTPGEEFKEIIQQRIKESQPIGFKVFDNKGQEWNYSGMTSEAYTVIALTRKEESQPAIKLIYKKTGSESQVEFVVATIKDGKWKEVFYGSDGKVKSIEDVNPGKAEKYGYEFDSLPKSINPEKTKKKFMEGARSYKAELPALVPGVEGNKVIQTQVKILQTPPVRKAA